MFLSLFVLMVEQFSTQIETRTNEVRYMTTQEFCKAFNLTVDQFYGREIINKSIYFEEENITEFPKGFNPNVKGHLDLGEVKYIPKGFSPIVSGNLTINDAMFIGKNFAPTIGYSLFASNLITIPKGFSPIVGCDLNIENIKSYPLFLKEKVGNNIYYNLQN